MQCLESVVDVGLRVHFFEKFGTIWVISGALFRYDSRQCQRSGIPKGPKRQAKLGSYKIALKTDAQIIAVSCSTTKYWEMGSWDKLRLPKPFGEIYVEFSNPMKITETSYDVNNADNLTLFLNNHLNALDNTIK